MNAFRDVLIEVEILGSLDLAKRVVQRVRGDEVLIGEDTEAVASRHLGKDLESAGGDIGAVEAAVREKTAGMRTIIS